MDSPYNVRFAGSKAGPTIMFGHGLGADQTFWEPVVGCLRHSYRLCLFNQAGASVVAASPREHNTLDDYASDLLDLHANLGLERVHYVGHSAGGMIGVLASLRRPEIFSSLTLICASPCYMNLADYHGGLEAEDIESYLNLMEQNFLGWAVPFAEVAAQDNALAQQLVSSFQRWDRTAIRQFARAIFWGDYRAVLPGVRIPTLLIHTDQDDIVPPSVAEYLHHNIAGSQLRVISTPGHCPHLTHAGTISSMIVEHVDSEP